MNDLSFARAAEIIERMGHKTIVVYGDIMLDEFVWGSVTRISPEAPVPVVDVQRESVNLGGAANVLANLIGLGARSCVVGLVGNDATGSRVRRELHAAGAVRVDETLVVDDARPTTIKTRIIAHNQLVVRADRERRTPAAAHIEDRLIEVLRHATEAADALIISDYDKGAITARVLAEILPLAARRRIPALVDPKIRNFNAYQPATLVTPNHHEALRLTKSEDDSDEGIAAAARLIRQQLACSSVLITRGERGMMLLEVTARPFM
ncbi:MAG: bifunctional ADP-heptose synthase [Pyrinomonadaceae bacterium]